MAFHCNEFQLVRRYISPALKANGAKECERRRRQIEAGKLRAENGLQAAWCPAANGDCVNNCDYVCVRADVYRA